MAFAAHPVGGTSPARYTAGDKVEAAWHGIFAAMKRGYAPLLASVTGSALRGLVTGSHRRHSRHWHRRPAS